MSNRGGAGRELGCGGEERRSIRRKMLGHDKKGASAANAIEGSKIRRGVEILIFRKKSR